MVARDSQLWHDILTTCNHALKLPKCGYHAIIFKFEPSGEPILQDSPTCEIVIKDQSSQPLNITRWPTAKATEYLGAHKCPANQTIQYITLKKKCHDFAWVINSSRLTRSET